MPYPDSLLSRGERVVLHKHPHWKVLVLPALVFVLVVGGGAAFIAWVTHWNDAGFTSHLPWIIATIVVGVLLLIWLVLVPVLRWSTEHFVISTAHVFFRTGILRRREHQIPLARIQNMETEVSFWGRILGYGSLIVESAADQPLEFENVASLSTVQSTLNQLISDDRSSFGESSAGDGSAGRRANPQPLVDDRGPEPDGSGRRATRRLAPQEYQDGEYQDGDYQDGDGGDADPYDAGPYDDGRYDEQDGYGGRRGEDLRQVPTEQIRPTGRPARRPAGSGRRGGPVPMSARDPRPADRIPGDHPDYIADDRRGPGQGEYPKDHAQSHPQDQAQHYPEGHPHDYPEDPDPRQGAPRR